MQGERFEVDDALYAETLDVNGNSFLDLDASAQVQRWGKVRFLPGEPPEDMVIGGDDDLVMLERGLAALKHARAISDPRERDAAVQEVWTTYGAYMRDLAQDFR